MDEKEIEELRNDAYGLGLPFAAFFNDIATNRNPDYHKDQAYKDFRIVVDMAMDQKPHKRYKAGDEIALPPNALKSIDCETSNQYIDLAVKEREAMLFTLAVLLALKDNHERCSAGELSALAMELLPRIGTTTSTSHEAGTQDYVLKTEYTFDGKKITHAGVYFPMGGVFVECEGEGK